MGNFVLTENCTVNNVAVQYSVTLSHNDSVTEVSCSLLAMTMNSKELFSISKYICVDDGEFTPATLDSFSLIEDGSNVVCNMSDIAYNLHIMSGVIELSNTGDNSVIRFTI